jgi:hypothetical protein
MSIAFNIDSNKDILIKALSHMLSFSVEDLEKEGSFYFNPIFNQNDDNKIFYGYNSREYICTDLI